MLAPMFGEAAAKRKPEMLLGGSDDGPETWSNGSLGDRRARVVVVVVATENSATLGRRLRRRLLGRGIQEGEQWKRGEEACSSSWVTPEVSDLEGCMISIAFKQMARIVFSVSTIRTEWRV